MSDDTNQFINTSLSQLVEGSYDGLINAGIIGNSLYGQFITNGQVHDFELSEHAFQHQEYRPDSIALNDFASGYLDSIGVRCDSEVDSVYEYLKGFIGKDIRCDSEALLRTDRKPMVCKSGGVACGKRCLPRGQKCRKGVGGAIANTAKRVIGQVKTKGSVANKLVKVALVGAGVVAGSKALGEVGVSVATGSLAHTYHKNGGLLGQPISKEEAIDIAKNQVSEQREYTKLANEHNKIARKINKTSATLGVARTKDVEKYTSIKNRLKENRQKMQKTSARLGY